MACAAFFVAVIPLSFVHRELGAFRNWQTGLNVLMLAGLLWQGRAPGRSLPRVPIWALVALAVCSGLSLLTNQLFKFYAFTASGSDFPIFDRMLFETNHGRFMYAPTVELNHLGIHPTYVMLLLVPLHALFESPLLLVIVTFVAVWGGAAPLWLLARHLWSEGAALLAVVAYLTNPWLISVLDGGFRPEVFYPATGLSFLLGWVQRRPRLWGPALLVLLGIKEDAALMLLGFTVAALLFEPERRRAALVIGGASLALLLTNVAVVQPYFLRGASRDSAAYGRFWGQYGRSFTEIALGMASSPLSVLADVVRSSWYRFFGAALFLPLCSRALLPMLPMLLILGTSASPMMARYQWYYPLPLIPFAFWGLLDAHQRLPLLRGSPRVREAIFLAALLLFPLVGGGYMRFPIPSLARLRALGTLQARLLKLPEVCAQEAIAPHVPYRVNVHLLVADCLARPDAVAVVNARLDPYPYEEAQLQRWIDDARAGGRLEELGGDFHLIRGLRLDPE